MNGSNYRFNRFMASLIDGLLMFIIFVAINITPMIVLIRDAMSEHYILSDALWLGFSIFASFCVWILYLFIPVMIFKNATVGMRIMHLAFVRTNGNTLNARCILFRQTSIVISIVFSLGFSLIFDPISLICSENGKNFYDIFSSTKVVSSYDL